MFKMVVFELHSGNIVGDASSDEYIVVNPNCISCMKSHAPDTTYILMQDGTHHVVIGELLETASIVQDHLNGLEESNEEA